MQVRPNYACSKRHVSFGFDTPKGPWPWLHFSTAFASGVCTNALRIIHQLPFASAQKLVKAARLRGLGERICNLRIGVLPSHLGLPFSQSFRQTEQLQCTVLFTKSAG